MVAAVGVVVEEGRAPIRSAVVVFGSPGEVEGQVQVQGTGVEGSTGIRCWDWGKTPRSEQGVVESSRVVERVAGDKVAHEVVREEALEEEEDAAVEVVVAVVDEVVAATYTARVSDHTARNSHTKHPELALHCSVAEAGQEEDNTQDSRASSLVDTSAGTHTGMAQKGTVCHVQSDRRAQDLMSRACSGHTVPYKDQASRTHCG